MEVINGLFKVFNQPITFSYKKILDLYRGKQYYIVANRWTGVLVDKSANADLEDIYPLADTVVGLCKSISFQ
jgi:hypothetical protein